uniref:NADH dehydrogenase subunit 4L n=1 Tax=Cichlidogyrus halli TaxID=321991 RepID=UPI00315CBA87
GISSWWIWLITLFILMSCFSTTRASFITTIIFIELLNIFVLVSCFFSSSAVGWFLQFLVFIVVATMEVVISLVSLTRLWYLGIFVY